MCDLDSVIIPCVQRGSRVNPLLTNDTDLCHETFSFMIYPAMSLGDKSYVNRKYYEGVVDDQEKSDAGFSSESWNQNFLQASHPPLNSTK